MKTNLLVFSMIFAGCSGPTGGAKETPPPAASSIKIRLQFPDKNAQIKLNDTIPFRGEVECRPGQEDSIKNARVYIGNEIALGPEGDRFGQFGSLVTRLSKDSGGKLVFSGVIDQDNLPKKAGRYRLTATYAEPVSNEQGVEGRPKQPTTVVYYRVIP